MLHCTTEARRIPLGQVFDLFGLCLVLVLIFDLSFFFVQSAPRVEWSQMPMSRSCVCLSCYPVCLIFGLVVFSFISVLSLSLCLCRRWPFMVTRSSTSAAKWTMVLRLFPIPAGLSLCPNLCPNLVLSCRVVLSCLVL